MPHRVSVALLGLLLLIAVPLFVCMPLTSDTVLYDLQARTVLQGGVLYRDILEPNLPGIVWIHLLLRSLVGWSSEAIRMADLAIVAAGIGLLAAVARRSAGGIRHSSATSLLILVCTLFYLSRNEWCHCQRDSWMLLPTGAALLCRRLRPGSHGRSACLWRLSEGVLWGAAFWIKPHIGISVTALLAADLVLTSDRMGSLRSLLLIMAGGLLAAVPGIVWLAGSGTWPHFLEMQLNWNPEYLQSIQDRRSWKRVWMMLIRFHPWWMVHVMAVPLAIRCIGTSLRHRIRTGTTSPESCSLRRGSQTATTADPAISLAIVYLTWFLQASLLQHSLDYIQVPPVLLGLAFLSALPWTTPVIVRRSTLAAFAGLALLAAPPLQPNRMSLWPDCFREGSSMALRGQLAVLRFPDWAHLQQVCRFLQSQHVRDREVTTFDVHCIHVLPALDVMPSSRYLGSVSLLQLFPSRRDDILETLHRSRHRFLVADLDETPSDAQQYPWNLPTVFSSGPFRVYQVAAPATTTSSDRPDDTRRR